MKFVANVVILFLAFASLSCMVNQKGRTAPFADVIDFTYILNGEEHSIGEHRGIPVLLVLMRTSEVTSDMYMDEVVDAFKKYSGDALFLVLSIAPNEEPMLQAYCQFKKLPFDIGLASFDVALGKTALGIIPIVPSTYLIGRDGRVSDMAAGVTTSEKILKTLSRYKFKS
jgi:hypothetical protein